MIRIMLAIRIMVMIRIMVLFSKLEKRISASGSSATQAMVSRVPAARNQLPTSCLLKVLARTISVPRMCAGLAPPP